MSPPPGLPSDSATTRMRDITPDQILNNSYSKELAMCTRSNAADSSAKTNSTNGNTNVELPAIDFADQIEQVFPNIDPDFVSMFIQQDDGFFASEAPNGALCLPAAPLETFINYVLQFPSYPMKGEQATDSTPNYGKYRNHRSCSAVKAYQNEVLRILKAEFPSIPQEVFNPILQKNETLYRSYLGLYKHIYGLEPHNGGYRAFEDQWPFERHIGYYPVGQNMKDGLAEELHLATKAANRIHGEYITKWAKEDTISRTSTNLSSRPDNKIECQWCYNDVIPTLTISCQSPNRHAFCLKCIRKFANTQIGYMRYKIQCMHDSGCEATFLRSQLLTALGPQVLNKLESIQQEDELREAGLEGLESCPFCDFQAIYPPVEDNPVFHCLKESCKKSSCRLCREGDHARLTCQEHQQKLGSRRRVEEAMSDALIRRCPNPQCRVAIVKVDGCNKVQCTRCGRFMCFVCSQDITTVLYQHFDRRTRCQTHDQGPITPEHVRQVERTTIAQILQELPHLREDDLRVDKPLPIRTVGTGTGGAEPQVTNLPELPPRGIHDELGRLEAPELIGGLDRTAGRYQHMMNMPLIARYPSRAAIERNVMAPNPFIPGLPQPASVPPLDTPRSTPQPRPLLDRIHFRLETPTQQLNENHPFLRRPPPQSQPDALTERRFYQGYLSPPAQPQPQNHPGAQVQPTGENNPVFSRHPQPLPFAAVVDPRAQPPSAQNDFEGIRRHGYF